MAATCSVDRGYATATGRPSGFVVDHSEYPCACRSSGSVLMMSSASPSALSSRRISAIAYICRRDKDGEISTLGTTSIDSENKFNTWVRLIQNCGSRKRKPTQPISGHV